MNIKASQITSDALLSQLFLSIHRPIFPMLESAEVCLISLSVSVEKKVFAKPCTAFSFIIALRFIIYMLLDESNLRLRL